MLPPIPATLADHVADYRRRFQTCLGRVVVSAPEPHLFLAIALAAAHSDCPLFLANPHWQTHEWQQVKAQVQPTWINGDRVGEPGLAPAPIMIPTGGSSGNIRFAMHTWSGLAAAVQAIQAHFGVTTIHSFCVLPLYHVSGWMQVMRSLLTGGDLKLYPEPWFSHNPRGYWLSLVPTQLHRCLQNPDAIAWLRGFDLIFVGGAPAAAALLTVARAQQLPLSLCYGATETAAMVTALTPQAFWAGNTSCGSPLPHASLQIEAGAVCIKATSLMQGYYPDLQADIHSGRGWQSGDLGRLDDHGHLYLQGRQQPRINSGGEKINPAEVESVLLASGLITDVVILGLPDPEWGEVVTAIYTPATVAVEPLRQWLGDRLSTYKIPKRWFGRDLLPRNSHGKLLRDRLRHELLNPAP